MSDLPSEVVCVADAISVGWSAASRAQVTAKEVPLVIGCGAVALSVIAQLKRLGVGPIVAVDFVAARRQTALAMGADVVIDPAECSPFEAWQEVAEGAAAAVGDMLAMAALRAASSSSAWACPGCSTRSSRAADAAHGSSRWAVRRRATTSTP